jgi:hypothetical protein
MVVFSRLFSLCWYAIVLSPSHILLLLTGLEAAANQKFGLPKPLLCIPTPSMISI